MNQEDVLSTPSIIIKLHNKYRHRIVVIRLVAEPGTFLQVPPLWNSSVVAA